MKKFKEEGSKEIYEDNDFGLVYIHYRKEVVGNDRDVSGLIEHLFEWIDPLDKEVGYGRYFAYFQFNSLKTTKGGWSVDIKHGTRWSFGTRAAQTAFFSPDNKFLRMVTN
jgi:hypothetical protein